MKRIDLTIKALSPLAIGKQKPGSSVSEALNYIPGTVIRGAIAAQILQRVEPNNENFAENGGDFQALFLGEEPAIFQNGYPSVAKLGAGKNKIVTDKIRFLPATAVSSKTKPGFKVSGNGVFDTLVDRFCAQALNHHPYDPNDPQSLKDKTDPRVEPYGGFYSRSNTGEYYSHSVSTRFLTRVGINRRRATSEDDILYSIEVLNEYALINPQADEDPKKWENVVYQSAILIADEALAERLKKFINNNTHNFRLGGSASRGLGKVEITAKIVDLKKIEDSKSEVELRLEKFNTKFQERWELWSSIFNPSKQKQLENKKFFTLNLQSDAILTEQWRSTTVISEAMLKDFAEVEVEADVKLEAAYSSYDYLSGWNSAWGLMKDVELVINKGAVYLFSTTQPEKWYAALAELEVKGIGERTSEGFGQLEICNDFHLVFREHAV